MRIECRNSECTEKACPIRDRPNIACPKCGVERSFSDAIEKHRKLMRELGCPLPTGYEKKMKIGEVG